MRATNNHHSTDVGPAWTRDPSMYDWARSSEGPGGAGASSGHNPPAEEEARAGRGEPQHTPGIAHDEPTADTSARAAAQQETPASPNRWSAPSTGASRTTAATATPSDTDTTPAPSALDNSLVRPQREIPQYGWRRAVWQASFGLITPRISDREVRRRQWITAANTNVPGATSITVASMKGGVGKTTVSALLGLTLAQHRGDRAVAIDANPDAGTLADRLLGVEADTRRPTIRDLLKRIDTIEAGTQLNKYLGLADRLAVLASEDDPAKSEQFNQAEYEAVAILVARFYDVLITDSGTGLVHSAMHGALNLTDGLVIVGAPTVDAAKSAGKTLDWLTEHGFGELVTNAVVAISCDRYSPDVDRGRIRDHFAARCRAVVEIPADPHLATGGRIDLRALQQPTLDAALELSAYVAQHFHHRDTSTLMSRAGLI